jgi:glutaryl-CoA dehydrogenase
VRVVSRWRQSSTGDAIFAGRDGLESALMAFKFQGVDFMDFDSLLSQDEVLVRTNTRAFIEDNLIPIIEQCNRDGRFPRELVRPMGELGFFGATIDG